MKPTLLIFFLCITSFVYGTHPGMDGLTLQTIVAADATARITPRHKPQPKQKARWIRVRVKLPILPTQAPHGGQPITLTNHTSFSMWDFNAASTPQQTDPNAWLGIETRKIEMACSYAKKTSKKYV